MTGFYVCVSRWLLPVPLQKDGVLRLQDLKRCKLSGNFFNILFNLNKFVAFETRDPFLIRQVTLLGAVRSCAVLCCNVLGLGNHHLLSLCIAVLPLAYLSYV